MCIIKFDFKDSIIYSAKQNHFNVTNVKHLHMVVSKSYLMQYFIFAHSKQRGVFNAFCLLLGPKRLVILVLHNFMYTINQVQQQLNPLMSSRTLQY